jgi:sugar/nucleoside kinase (ribokinase family)
LEDFCIINKIKSYVFIIENETENDKKMTSWYDREDMRRSLFDVLAIGDCMLDVFVNIHEASVSCALRRDACQLCLPYGEKVPVEGITKIPGAGNSSNAAVGFARLGFATAMVSTIGNDETGQMILTHWRKEGIATHLVVRDKKLETNYSTILSFQGERTILVYHQPYRYTLPNLPKTKWIYYSSLGKGHERLEKQLLAYLSAHPTTKLTFNPGTHQLRRGIKAIAPVISRSEVFIVNKEEAELLLETGRISADELLDQLHAHGARTTVITDGVHGSYATDGSESWHCPMFPGKEVERTGAGDSFATAFSYARFHGKTIPEALRYGTAQAWSVVQYVGPQAGLMTETKLEQVLKKFKRIQVKRI